MSTLRELVDRLTIETPQVVHHATGPVMIRARPLLAELQDARYMRGTVEGRSSSSSGSGAPLNVDALKVACQINDEMAHVQWVFRSAPTPPASELQEAADLFGIPVAAVVGPPRPAFGGLTVSERLRWVAVRATAAGREAEVLEVVRPWVAAIERLLDPPVVVRLRGVQCPACGVARTPVWDPDQEDHVETPALSIVMGTQPQARCAECGAEWFGPEVVDMAGQCGGSTSAAAHVLGG